MNYDRSLIFAYLEEDNIQRAYFRVRPLLTSEGDVQQEAVSLWPNEGGLRIVPDRNEQHTFKGRMRSLGAYCVVDLRGLPSEAGKIRTNKNYRPDHGEANQFILYSDTVHELPEHTFYQLFDADADDFAALAAQAVTPCFYIRNEDTLYGPVKKNAPACPQPAEEAAGMLYELSCPDGITRSILYLNNEAHTEAPSKPEQAKDQPVNEPVPQPAEESAPVKEPESASDESLALGETLHILDETQGHDDTLEQLNKPVSAGANLLHQPTEAPEPVSPQKNGPLTGTPLVKTPLHVSVQQTKNRTQEVVSNQWSVGKYESPAQNLPAGAKLRRVENPVEAACHYLREAWNATSAHDHLTDFILSLDDITNQLETKLCAGKTGTIMQRVLQQRLQDLEAERLAALCELDKAKRDVDAYKQELLTGMSARISKETKQLEADMKTTRDQLDELKREENVLLLQRDALIAKIEELQKANLPEAAAALFAQASMFAPSTGIPLRITPVSGSDADLETLIFRLTQVCADSGVTIDRNYAIALLVLLAVSPRIGISCATTAAASTLLQNIAQAFGWQSSYAHQYAAEQQPLVGIRPVSSTPAILTTSLPNYAPVPGVTKLTLSRNTSSLIRNAAYDVCQWPILMLPSLPFIPALENTGSTISEEALKKISLMTAADSAELDAVLQPILRAASPLNGNAKAEMYRFVSVCAALMEGGLPSAVDWAVLLWIIPALDRDSRHHSAVKAQLDEYPLSLAKL